MLKIALTLHTEKLDADNVWYQVEGMLSFLQKRHIPASFFVPRPLMLTIVTNLISRKQSGLTGLTSSLNRGIQFNNTPTSMRPMAQKPAISPS